MKVFIVHCHPEAQSFNAAMTHTAKTYFESNGHAVIISDLYQMGFDPVSDRKNFTTVKDPHYFKQQIEELHASENDGFAASIENELKKLETCDVLIFQFPLWWFGLPAMLKGWVDRVMVMGRVYGGGKWYDEGGFKGKRAMLALTTGGPESTYAPDGLNGDIEAILYPINHGILRFVGFDVLPPFIAWSPAHADAIAREAYLQAYQQRLATLTTTAPIAYPPLAAYDPETYRLRAGDTKP
jgi:NAD(P)H dehydrogenase (quinone)